MSLRSPFVASVTSVVDVVVVVSRRISFKTLSRLCLLPLTSSAKSEVSLILIVFLVVVVTLARREGEGDRERAGEGLR